MRLVKLGIANIDSTVGAVRSNVDRCVEVARALGEDGVTVAAFPEQVIGGYAAEDLVQWRAFVDEQAEGLLRFAKETADLRTVLAIGLTVSHSGDLFNCAAIVHAGRILALVPKEKLPTYNVFYEARTLSRGEPHMEAIADLAGTRVPLGDFLAAFDFGVLAVEVCEDVWSPDGPMRRRAYSGAELILNLSASPYRAGIVGTRREMIATRAADNQVTLVYANLVGANDGLVFDGGGFVNQNGRPVLEAERFREGRSMVVVDLDRTSRSRHEASTWRSDREAFRAQNRLVPSVRSDALTADRSKLAYPRPAAGTTFFLPSAAKPERTPREELLDDFFEVLALGVAGYFRKTAAFDRLGLALSGGRDSLLTLLVAWRAVSLLHPGLSGEPLREKTADMLHAFFMPTRFSSSATARAAEQIAKDVGATFLALPIEEAFEREMAATSAMLAGEKPTPITEQNVQARIRGLRMWNWSNTARALFLQTGNMSEKSVGYTTIGGDLEGCFSVIANVPKTVVMALLDRLLERFGFEGIKMTLATVPGPELAQNQSGEAELMPYEVLDACLYLHGAEKLSPAELAEALPAIFPERDPVQLGDWAYKFVKLFTISIYKWVQAPLAIHLGSLDLDRERALQLPVVQKTEWGGRKKLPDPA